MSLHNGLKSFQFKYCPQKFTVRKLLQGHVLTHTGDKLTKFLKSLAYVILDELFDLTTQPL